MELTLKELKKRDVVNVADGRCLGKITNITFSFPKGVIIGITVPGKNTNVIARFFDRSRLYIEVSNIIKIGGDVILVNINCGDCVEDSSVPCKPKNHPPKPPCPSPCNNGPRKDGEKGSIDDIDFSKFDISDL